MMPEQIEVSVSEFVALLNQTLEFAYPDIVVIGELANFRVSKNRWVYFDLKDELATVRFFGTVYQLPGPLEDGMILKVRGQPRLHSQYGFSVNVMSMQPAGEGSIRKAADLLQAKLAAEGLFDESRKRALPYPPGSIGLITSKQSAAYADFIKVMAARWRGIDITLVDVQVQGEPAPAQIVQAIEQFNGLAEPPEILVVIRGGGSAEDLAAFSTEQVTRAVAASRVPTLVAIGHEIDLSLAELAADQRASTPSNAAELLVPDRAHISKQLQTIQKDLEREIVASLRSTKEYIEQSHRELQRAVAQHIANARQHIVSQGHLLKALSPTAILQRGYAIVRHENQVLRSHKSLSAGAIVEVELADGGFSAQVTEERSHGSSKK